MNKICNISKNFDNNFNEELKKNMQYTKEYCHAELVSASQGFENHSNCSRLSRKFAFTLAETLITLVIIGVVAALTVPTMITKYQKEQTVTQVKKAYSILNQAVQSAFKDYGTLDSWDLPEGNSQENSLYMYKKYILPYLNVSKIIENPTPEELTIHTISGGDETMNNNYIKIYLNDGMAIYGGYNYNETSHKSLTATVDINGDKKPNKMGRDIFQFKYWIFYPNDLTIQGRFLPNFFDFNLTDEQIKSKCSSTYGNGCATKIMKDGWQIKDDYPW